MPYPKLSASLNNCPLHALTPEIKDQVLNFALNKEYINGHNAQYERLKNIVANGYEIAPDTFTWQQFADILKRYNAFDTQIIMGPILRTFMKEPIATDSRENQGLLVIGENVSAEKLMSHLTDIDPVTSRYKSLSPDVLFNYVASRLGFNLQYHSGGTTQLCSIRTPIATIDIYHQGGIDGAEVGGHWERTLLGLESVDYQSANDSQLDDMLTLLGQNTHMNFYGFTLLKRHIQLTLREAMGENPMALAKEFTELALTPVQIQKYLFNSLSVPQALAIKLLGQNLTPITLGFIQRYPCEAARPNTVIERYIRAQALPTDKIDAREMEIITTLRAPVLLSKASLMQLEARGRLVPIKSTTDEFKPPDMSNAQVPQRNAQPKITLSLDEEDTTPFIPSDRLRFVKEKNNFVARQLRLPVDDNYDCRF